MIYFPNWIFGASLVGSATSAVLTCVNLRLYRKPPAASPGEQAVSVSVIVPARNEEAGIAACVASLLSAGGVAECVIVDDDSTDATRAICERIAAKDNRLRVVSAPILPEGWNGKQHACWFGASLATNEVLVFLDADVRIRPSAIVDMAAFRSRSGASLVSGIPRQWTITPMEWLLLPFIQFLLMGFYPLAVARRLNAPSLAAGCGQFLLVERSAYFACGGHQKISATMHDGLKLPRAFRAAGLRTDIADLTDLATCRMYHSAREVWLGLSKNATEGMASLQNILPFTLLLGFGQVLPLPLCLLAGGPYQRKLAFAALCLSYGTRLMDTIHFRQSRKSMALHPIGVLLLLMLQWWALLQKLTGLRPVWRQRSYEAG